MGLRVYCFRNCVFSHLGLLFSLSHKSWNCYAYFLPLFFAYVEIIQQKYYRTSSNRPWYNVKIHSCFSKETFYKWTAVWKLVEAWYICSWRRDRTGKCMTKFVGDKLVGFVWVGLPVPSSSLLPPLVPSEVRALAARGSTNWGPHWGLLGLTWGGPITPRGPPHLGTGRGTSKGSPDNTWSPPWYR